MGFGEVEQAFLVHDSTAAGEIWLRKNSGTGLASKTDRNANSETANEPPGKSGRMPERSLQLAARGCRCPLAGHSLRPSRPSLTARPLRHRGSARFRSPLVGADSPSLVSEVFESPWASVAGCLDPQVPAHSSIDALENRERQRPDRQYV